MEASEERAMTEIWIQTIYHGNAQIVGARPVDRFMWARYQQACIDYEFAEQLVTWMWIRTKRQYLSHFVDDFNSVHFSSSIQATWFEQKCRIGCEQTGTYCK